MYGGLIKSQHSFHSYQVIWKTLYGQTSRDHGTLGYFKSLLNRTTVKNDPKKEVNASLEFLLTVVKGHILAVACEVLGVTKLDSPLQLPPGLREGDSQSQLSFLRRLALQVVDRCTLVGAALTRDKVVETQDGVYNYARVLCHFGALVMEFLDAWAEGDGDRMYCCYRLFLPHFIIANCRKYSLEVLRLQTQVKAMLSPHLAHHILWDRFINTKGGMGNNIPCNLHNEHINKLLKGVIANMGSNLTEVALRRAAQSVSFIQSICHGFDRSSGVPFGTHAHSTRTDEKDVARVVSTVLKEELLVVKQGRKHNSYRRIHTNPLWKWKVEETQAWIDKKKKDFLKYRGAVREEIEDDSDIEDTDATNED